MHSPSSTPMVCTPDIGGAGRRPTMRSRHARAWAGSPAGAGPPFPPPASAAVRGARSETMALGMCPLVARKVIGGLSGTDVVAYRSASFRTTAARSVPNGDRPIAAGIPAIWARALFRHSSGVKNPDTFDVMPFLFRRRRLASVRRIRDGVGAVSRSRDLARPREDPVNRPIFHIGRASDVVEQRHEPVIHV